MKKDIHPKVHPVTLKMTNGTTLTVLSTYNYGKKNVELLMDVDPYNHATWTKVRNTGTNTTSRSRYKKKWGELSMMNLSDQANQ